MDVLNAKCYEDSTILQYAAHVVFAREKNDIVCDITKDSSCYSVVGNLCTRH